MSFCVKGYDDKSMSSDWSMKSHACEGVLHADDSILLRSFIVRGYQTGVMGFLCEKGVSVNTSLLTSDNTRTFPLHVAADVKPADYHHELVTYFISMEADCNIVDSKGCAPLHYTALHNNIVATQALLDAGANVNLRTNFPLAPSKEGTFVCFPKRQRKQMNRRRKAEVQSLPLHLLLRTDCDFDLGVDGLSALPISENRDCHTSPVELVKILLAHGADCNLFDGCGFAPIHYAVMQNDIALVRILLDGGAFINIATQDENSHTSVFLAKDVKMLQFLLSRNAYPETLLADGRNLLICSIIKSQDAITKYLVTEVPVLLHVKNSNSPSPLGCVLNIFISLLYFNDAKVNEVEELKHIILLMLQSGCDPASHMFGIKNSTSLCAMLNKPKHKHLMSTMEELSSSPRSLQSLCAIRIRSILRKDISITAETLPLPTTLKERIKLKYMND